MADGAEGESLAVIVSLGTMVINLVVAIGAGVWALAHSRTATDEKIAEKERSLTNDLADLERRMRSEINNNERNYGETSAAIRQKVTEIQLWTRDHLVDRAAFNASIADFRRMLERFDDKISTRLDLIQKKLDSKNDADSD